MFDFTLDLSCNFRCDRSTSIVALRIADTRRGRARGRSGRGLLRAVSERVARSARRVRGALPAGVAGGGRVGPDAAVRLARRLGPVCRSLSSRFTPVLSTSNQCCSVSSLDLNPTGFWKWLFALAGRQQSLVTDTSNQLASHQISMRLHLRSPSSIDRVRGPHPSGIRDFDSFAIRIGSDYCEPPDTCFRHSFYDTSCTVVKYILRTSITMSSNRYFRLSINTVNGRDEKYIIRALIKYVSQIRTVHTVSCSRIEERLFHIQSVHYKPVILIDLWLFSLE